MLIYFFARFQIEVYDESHKTGASNGCGDESAAAAAAAAAAEAALPLRLQMTSQGKTWILRRSYEHFRLLDQQLHRCIYDRKFSQLPDLPPAAPPSTDPDAPPTDEVLFFFCLLSFLRLLLLLLLLLLFFSGFYIESTCSAFSCVDTTSG